MRDSYGRLIDYLRLSVTDRCNLRCVYCLPQDGAVFSSGQEQLTDDEIVCLAGCLARLGISKVRVTGGEPLVRPGIVDLIARLARVSGIEDLSLSTNGVLLVQYAGALKKAGLSRVNVSLDSLRPARFQTIARFGALADVWRGIDAALTSGLEPVKLNVVVARGMNDDEISDFADLTVRRAVHVRFIELMPMGVTGFFNETRRVPLPEMLRAAGAMFPLERGAWPKGHGPARYYRRLGARGTLGFISALSCGFCSDCNRVRLSSRGTFVPCLDGEDGVDLRYALRNGASPEQLESLIMDAVRGKPERHTMLDKTAPAAANPRFMCQIGG